MVRRWLAVAVSVLALTLAVAVTVACSAGGGDGTPLASGPPSAIAGTLTALATTPPATATPVATPVPPSAQKPPFEVAGPVTPNDDLITAVAVGDFVLEARTGDVYTLTPPRPEDRDLARPEGWLDDTTLLVRTSHAAFAASLDGRISPLAPPPPTPTPSARAEPGGEPLPSMTLSPDGAWFVLDSNPSGHGQIQVGPAGGDATRVIEMAARPAWSPGGHLLAYIGDYCAGFNLMLLDPATGQERKLTASLGAPTFELVWKPDASAIAFDSFSSSGAMIALVDLESGTITPVLRIHRGGDFRLRAWNPSGTMLLFEYVSGRGFCD